MAYPTDSGVTYTTKVMGDTIQPSDVNNLQTETSAIKTLLGTIGSVIAGTFYYILSEITGSDKAVGKTATQTLTNKTLTSPVINSPTGLVKGDVGLGNVDNTSDATKNSATATLTNKTLTAPVISTISNTGTLTLPTSTDTLVGRATTDTLTNKTLTTPTITKPVMDATNPTAQTYTPSAGGTATLDLSLANQHRITMPAGNITIALSNDTNSQIFTISITQDGTGSRTVTWFSTIKWATGTVPTLTTTANKRDQFIFIRTGSGTYDGFIVGQNI